MPIAAVLKQRPDLTIDGLAGHRRPDFEQRQAELLAATDQFERAVAWFSLVPKVKTAVIKGSQYSYKIKHEIGSWSGGYVSNGAAIAAALHMGFAIKDSGDIINCWIAASKKRPTKPRGVPPPPY